jgi:hypothetical protein
LLLGAFVRIIRAVAIDLIVIPLSRYWSGDYVTPAMRLLWEQGIPYSVVTPDGPRTLPPGQPYGGADAATEREKLLENTLPGLLDKLASVTVDSLWDEKANVEPCFYRPSNSGIAALMEAAVKLARPKRLPWGRKVPMPARHLAHAVIHLPVRFADPLDAAGMVFGSLFAVEAELAANTWPAAASDAVVAFQAAVSDAKRMKLPLVVDS